MSTWDEFDEVEWQQPKGKMRCRTCLFFCYDFIFQKQDPYDPPYCGLHGRQRVDPDGPQQNLDRSGSCGYARKDEPQQLTLF